VILIRRAIISDVNNVIDLFSNTVRSINSKDYSKDQIKIWSSFRERDSWIKKIADQNFYVGIISKRIVGFSSIDDQGYIDYLYVHKNFQNQGIASSLLNQIVKKAKEFNLDRIWVSSSVTAKPFFQSKGFVQYEIEKKKIKNTEFENSLMEKYLAQ